MSSPVTVLPDGSAFCTAEIMSKEEAMSLPVEKRPICFRISGEMYHKVFENIGAASMCWNPKPSHEVFDSESAEKLAVDLCFAIAREVEGRERDNPVRSDILLEISSYLGNGGLFNPEAMDHSKVRDLIVKVRDYLAAL